MLICVNCCVDADVSIYYLSNEFSRGVGKCICCGRIFYNSVMGEFKKQGSSSRPWEYNKIVSEIRNRKINALEDQDTF